MKKALLIIDWENEWINPESEYYVGSDLASETQLVNRLIAYARINNYKVIFIKHVEPNGTAFKENDMSTDFIKPLKVEADDIVIKKNRISSFYKTDIEAQLLGIDELIIAGILTNLCVRSAIQDAYDRDFGITVVSDCCVALNDETQQFTFKDLKNTRPEIRIVQLNQVAN